MLSLIQRLDKYKVSAAVPSGVLTLMNIDGAGKESGGPAIQLAFSEQSNVGW